MCDTKIKNLNLMVNNVILPHKASTMFCTQWKNTNFPIWAKEIFVERFTRQKVPKYLSYWCITDDIVMVVLSNLLDMAGFISITGRSIYSMRTTPGNYKSIWKLASSNHNNNSNVIVEGQHTGQDILKCTAYVSTKMKCNPVSSINIKTSQYLPAFYESKQITNCSHNNINKHKKGFYLTSLTKTIQTQLLDPIGCELDKIGVKIYPWSSLLNNPGKLSDMQDLKINNNVADTNSTCEQSASNFWKDVINVRKHLAIGCPNCFDVKKQLSEENYDSIMIGHKEIT